MLLPRLSNLGLKAFSNGACKAKEEATSITSKIISIEHTDESTSI